MRWIWIAIVLLFACKSNTKEEVVDMNDVIPHAEKDYDEIKDIKNTKVFIPFNDSLAKSFKIKSDSISISESPVFLERFQPKSLRKINLFLKGDSTQFIHLSFKDSLALKNAFFNGLDCFGEKCITVEYFQNVKIQKKGFYYFVGEKEMIWVNNPKNKPEDWLLFLEKELGVKDWRIFIVQKPRAKIEWLKITDLKIEKNEGSK
jgi:hypothetical protein